MYPTDHPEWATSLALRGLTRGEVVTVTSDPVYAGGYIWYGVVDANNRSGFVAMGGGTTPWLVPAD